MMIGIVGSGRIGGTVARLFVRAGHEVALSNSRGSASLTKLAASLGPKVRAATVEEAIRFGEVVFLALPWIRRGTLSAFARLCAGRIVVDATNPYSATGQVVDLGDTTSSEEVARILPGARVVKAFNTMYYVTLGRGSKPSKEGRLVLFVAGDDRDAKKVVSQLIEEIGFAPMDTGGLREGGRRQQPGTSIYARDLTLPQAEALLGQTARTPDTESKRKSDR